jgi:hypothetical protein
VVWRSEARVPAHQIGRDFPFLNEDAVGDLFVLIPKTLAEFSAFLLDYDEDIEDIQASLGVQAFEQWGIYKNNAPVLAPETEDECVERCIREICTGITAFPAGDVFSEHARTTLMKCVRKFSKMSMDDTLLSLVETEYRIFQAAERIICQNAVAGCLFKDIDDFLHTAASIMNRRKARAGRSFENHVDHLLKQAGIPHVMRPSLGVAGAPDIIIPDVGAYNDETWPEDSLFVVGLKTTCKDRWRQVLNEAKRTKRKFIFTLQKGISRAQLDEMTESNVSLIVPNRLHKEYPADRRDRLWTVEGFVDHVRGRLATVSGLKIVAGPQCVSAG